jgi:hypothetical protein
MECRPVSALDGGGAEQAGILYVDAHVRVYHGEQTQLPRHYVARQRLCQRATADYWVNAIDGQPFFRVTQAVDPGLIKVLEGEILPRLERDIPGQPSAEVLAAEPLRHRFTLVFDREGYSPGLFQRLKARRVACLSYRKYPGDDWSPEEFVDAPIELRSGEQVRMRLAERGTLLGGVVWVREVRKLCDTGRQVALISTDYQSGIGPLAATLFARWSQENFFKYAREHFALDRLADYQTEEIPDTARVVNPARRTLDGQVRSLTSKLSRRLAQFGALNLDETIDPAKVDAFVAKKAAAHDEIEQLQEGLKTLKEQRKETPSPSRRQGFAGRKPVSPAEHPQQAIARHAQDDRLPCRNGDGQRPGTASCPPGRGPELATRDLHDRSRLAARPAGRHPDRSPPPSGQWRLRPRRPHTL